jgi:hypothetical protein
LKKEFNSDSFRRELLKIMPGYKWTIHRSNNGVSLSATGIQSIGFNRMSTLSVVRRDKDGEIEYEVKSAGFGLHAPWLKTCRRSTLARALRGLQTHYESVASKYNSHAVDLENGRRQSVKKGGIRP